MTSKPSSVHDDPRFRAAGMVLGTVLVGWALFFLYHRLRLMYSFNFNIEGIEELFSYLIMKIPQGVMYTDPEQYPFMVTQYPPIYLYLTQWLSHFVPVYPEESARALYIAARWLNLVCNLLSIALIFGFLRQQIKGHVWIPALMAVGVFQLFTSHHLALRPDSLKILFMTLLYLSFIAYFRKPTPKGFVLMLLAGVLAVLTKQDALIHIGGLGTILFLRRQFGNSILFVGASCAIVGVVLLAFCHWDFNLIHKNLVGGIEQGVSWDWLGRVFEWNYPGMILLPVLLLWVLYRLFKLDMLYAIPGALVVAFMTFMSLLKWGSNFNYLTEVQFLLVLFVMWDALHRASWKFYMIVVVVLGVFYWSNHIHNYQYFSVEKEAEYKEAYRDLRSAEIGFDLFAEEQSLENPQLITFDRPLSLLLIEHTLIGTLVNEYPEIFFETDVHKLSSVPIKVFDYQLTCGDWYMNDLYFYCRENRCPSDMNWLRSFSPNGPDLQLAEQYRTGPYICYKVICP